MNDNNLFLDEFPEIKSPGDIEKAKVQFPRYDEYYVVSGCIRDRRERFNKLWIIYEPHCGEALKKSLREQAKYDFHGRTWEMYLGVIFLTNGLTMKPQDQGPDIKISLDLSPIWVEAVTTKKGGGPDAVPEMQYGIIKDVPYDEMILRITQALDDKARTYQDYLSKSAINPGEPFIIAINIGLLEYPDAEIPLMLKVLFALGDLTIPVPLGGPPREPFFPRRESVKKRVGSSVPLGFFQKEENKGISAVIYSNNTVLNHPPVIGQDCILVHNPLAINSIPDTIFGFLGQHKLENNQIIKI